MPHRAPCHAHAVETIGTKTISTFVTNCFVYTPHKRYHLRQDDKIPLATTHMARGGLVIQTILPRCSPATKKIVEGQLPKPRRRPTVSSKMSLPPQDIHTCTGCFILNRGEPMKRGGKAVTAAGHLTCTRTMVLQDLVWPSYLVSTKYQDRHQFGPLLATCHRKLLDKVRVFCRAIKLFSLVICFLLLC